MAGGVAVGVNGHIHGFNADAEARLDNAMVQVGKWIDKTAGYFLGHVKMAIYTGDEGITLNLIDLSIGVEHHGTMAPAEKADYNFMAAVVDVDADELKHVMLHALEDSGVDICFDEHECHCHDHEHGHHHDGEECHCHDHDHDDHDGHKHHHDGEECHCHDHDHDDHDGHKHHHDGEECHCHGHHGHDEEDREEKKSFWDKVRRKK
jgi:hypothetical protein